MLHYSHINLKASTVALQITTAVSSDNSEEQPKSRGVKRGTNRRKYKRNSYEKILIVDAVENVDGDCSQDIPIGTAYSWIRTARNKQPKTHRGA